MAWSCTKSDKNIRSYSDAVRFIQAGKNMDRRTVQNNTTLERRGEDIAVRLHDTDIVIYHLDGTITLNTGGWHTNITKSRMEDYLPKTILDKGWYINSVRGRWYLGAVPLVDGLRIDPDGNPVNIALSDLTATVSAEDSANRAMGKRIDGYVRGLTGEVIKGLVTNAIERGTAGDCWLCAMGPAYEDTSHLLSHIEENYYMATLCVNAYVAKNYPNPQMMLRIDRDGSYTRRVVKSYLRSKLLKGVATK